MKPDRLRLSEFAKWVHETGPAVRGMLVRKEVPFDPEMKDGSQRTYNGADLLAWCLFTELRRLGIAARVAADVIRLSGVVGRFVEDVTQPDLNLIFYVTRRSREPGHPLAELGPLEVSHYEFGTADDVAEIIRGEAKGYAMTDTSGRQHLGLVSLVTLPLRPCYDRCRATAGAHGFDMVGADLFEA